MPQHAPSDGYVDRLLALHQARLAGAPSSIHRKALAANPALQQKLAAELDYSPSKWLLEQEAPLIQARRALHPQLSATALAGPVYDWARDNKLTGLCFSGGGIRSATFNLGVLQEMAARGRLQEFDYLSSVSGGGYIHSWLAGWLKRATAEKHQPVPQQAATEAWTEVTRALHPLSSGRPETPAHLIAPHTIQWLRRYSNYLTPRKGLLTGDTWSAFATWLRNVLLNQALLLFMFLAVLCLPHLLAPSTHVAVPGPMPAAGNGYGDQLTAYFTIGAFAQPLLHDSWLAVVAALVYIFGTGCIGWLLRLEYKEAIAAAAQGHKAEQRKHKEKKVRRSEFGLVCFGVILPLLVFGIMLSGIVRLHPASGLWTLRVFLLLLVLVWVETLCGGALGHSVALKRAAKKAESGDAGGPGILWQCATLAGLLALGVPAAFAGSLMAAAIGALLRSAWMVSWSQSLLLSDPRSLQVTLGTLLFFWLPPLTMVIAAGLIGKNFPDWTAEWLARIRAYTLVTGLGWIALCGSALLMPGAALRISRHHWAGWTGLGAWLVATFSGVISGKSGKTGGESRGSNLALNLVAMVAPYVYIAGLALVLAAVLEWVRYLGWQGSWWSLALLLGALAALLGWRLDINEFSMHNFYRNRLTRCYLGASNLKRNPSPVTGFDERDTNDLLIHQLKAPAYPGPIPIFCCAMNITTGEALAWQERKAASFAFTPAYSGYDVDRTSWDSTTLSFNGYVPTEMLYPGGPTVATAMAASGAAVSPNWGYHTNPATAFLLTMFDARLGLWMPNPRWSPFAGKQETKGKMLPSSPIFAPRWLINELLGAVTDTSKYVYVTDGGHFDNMGLYELVRRRCYRIVICDSEQDGTYDYEGIGAAIRKCRIDFGVEIDLDLAGLSPNTESQLSPGHVVHGYIRYPETPGEEARGTVTYIKASLTGRVTPPAPFWMSSSPKAAKGTVELPDVPGDVQNYKLQHADFPHDSTAEQWFTESQFESYRRLGQQVISSIGDRDLFTHP